MRDTTCSVIVSSVKIGTGGRSLRPVRRAVHVQMLRTRRNGAAFEHDLVAVDALDVTEPHDVLDLSEERELAGAERRALHHRRHHRPVDAQDDLALLEPLVDLLDRVALGDRFDLEHDAFERLHRALRRAGSTCGSAATSRAGGST